MTTARSIINQAARKIHVLGRGQTMPADEVNDALTALNNLLGTFSAQSGTIYNNMRESFPLTGVASYTIGAGGDFNTTRPIEITSMYVTIGQIDYPLEPLTPAEYANIAQKSVSGIPDSYYYEQNNPLSRIFLYPVGVAGYTLNIWSLKALTSFADLTTDYDLPEGVEDMLVHNLAVVIAPEYEKEASATVKTKARETKSAVEMLCRRNSYPQANIDLAESSAGTGNILTGWLTR